jgi:hypothetical protein
MYQFQIGLYVRSVSKVQRAWPHLICSLYPLRVKIMAPTPANPSFPAPNVYYRIQSVDLATYLELYDVSDEKVVMRPLKDCLEQQVSITS